MKNAENRLPNIEGMKFICDVCGGDHANESHEKAQKAEQEKLGILKEFLKRLTMDKNAVIEVENDTLIVKAKSPFKNNIEGTRKSIFVNIESNRGYSNALLEEREIRAELKYPIGNIKKIIIFIGEDI